MANLELENYIKKSLEQGVPEQEIKNALRSAGWQENDINDAFSKAKPSSSQPSSKEEVKVLNINETGEKVSKSNKKIGKILIISLIIIVLGAGGYFSYKYLMPKGQIINEITAPTIIPTSTPEEISTLTATSTAIDCEDNFDCLMQAAQDCSPARAIIATSTNVSDIKQTITSSYEIQGYQTEKCIFVTKIEKIDLVFPTSTPEDVVAQQKASYKTFEGREMVCKFSVTDLVAMIDRWKIGEFAIDDFDVAECSTN